MTIAIRALSISKPQVVSAGRAALGDRGERPICVDAYTGAHAGGAISGKELRRIGRVIGVGDGGRRSDRTSDFAKALVFALARRVLQRGEPAPTLPEIAALGQDAPVLRFLSPAEIEAEIEDAFATHLADRAAA